MTDSGLVTVSAGWAVVAGAILCSLAVFAIALDTGLTARAQGARGGWTTIAGRFARLLR